MRRGVQLHAPEAPANRTSLINLMKTLLLLAMLMYSGGRMSELVDLIQHSDLTAHGATPFPWLALAIIKPSTLVEVLPRWGRPMPTVT